MARADGPTPAALAQYHGDAGTPPGSPATPGVVRRSSGRPTREDALRRDAALLDVATALFLAHGYGSTSIDRIAQTARVSKRTLYQRYPDKAALFSAVVERVIQQLRPPAEVPLLVGNDLREILVRLGGFMVQATVMSQAVALHRLVVAESGRFPEVARAIHENAGTREAIGLVAELLRRTPGARPLTDAQADFAAQHFLTMVTAVPQRRAMGFGTPLSGAELAHWVRDTVDLFLAGCGLPA